MRKFTLGERFQLLREVVIGGRLLREAPRWSRDQMLAWQLDRVRALVRHAYESVPFYRELYACVGFDPGDFKTWADFELLPTITKDQVIESFPDKLVSGRFEFDKLIVSRSSGSSGKVLDVAYDARTLIAYALATIRIYRMGFDYHPWHRQVYIYTSPYPFNSIFGLYPLTFVSTLSPIEEVHQLLGTARPDLLVCYPSHLRQITDMASEADLQRIRPKLISVSSEMSSQAERDHLSSIYGCPALDNYSSEEMARIASQCRERTYHVFEDMNYVEILDGGDEATSELGTIIATNLHNWATPLIRYRQNDLAQVDEHGCACGRRFRRLRSLEGRRNDCFVLPSGRVLTSGFLLDATYEFLLNHRSAARDFCLVQEAPARVLLEVVPGAGWSERVGRKIGARFGQFLEPGVAFRIAVVEECEKTRTGKRNPIINRAISVTSHREVD